MGPPRPISARIAAAMVLGLGAAPALAQPDANGFEWATITNPGNAPYTGFDPFGYVTGRGSVGYEYRMARTEVSTGQWMEFFNTFCPREGNIPWVSDAFPALWGAGIDPTYTGPGHRFRLKGINDAAHVGVYGVTWRTCAMYCNWLNNGKSSDAASLLSGAYDVSTFHDNVDGTFTDQPTHSPGAQYWIPSLDEWLKSAHWSPTNPNNGGWYTYSNGSEIALTYGPPPSFGGDGTGQANAVFRLSGSRQYDIPLGSYPNTPSIWGLLDIAGAGREWTEGVLRDGQGAIGRMMGGSSAAGPSSGDIVYGMGGVEPWTQAGNFNFRLASAVPSPGGFVPLGLALSLARARSRTRTRRVPA